MIIYLTSLACVVFELKEFIQLGLCVSSKESSKISKK